MRTMMVICIHILAMNCVLCAETLPVTGQIVDSQARPVEGAEVVVYGQSRAGGPDYDAKLISPMVTTDAQGRFQLQADEFRQWDTFIVARKEGLALAWDGLNYGANTKGKGHFLLVLEPPCSLAGQLTDADGHPVADAQVQVVPVNSYLDRLRQRPILAPKEWFTTTTDSQGRFSLTGFAADVSASFRVKAPGRDSIHVLRVQEQNSCGYEVWRSDLRLQLNEKTRSLHEKGVMVVAIQASTMERAPLDAWVRENRIACPVGLVTGDERQTRFDWGVKSLPWLVLTDREHKVVAEGFVVDELEERLARMTTR